MAADLEPVITCCEGCGAEDPVLSAKVRTFKLTNGGAAPMVPATPLRAPFYCSSCRALLDDFVKALGAGTAKTIHVKRNGPWEIASGPVVPTR